MAERAILEQIVQEILVHVESTGIDPRSQSWVLTTARNLIIDEEKHRRALDRLQIYKALLPTRKTMEDFIPGWNDKLQETLQTLNYDNAETANLNIEGNKNPKIADLLNISEALVRKRLQRVRMKIESEIIYPNCLNRVSDYRENRLQSAACIGAMDAAKFLNLWYTDDKGVELYNRRAALSCRPRNEFIHQFEVATG